MTTWGDPGQRPAEMEGRGGNPPMRPDQAAALPRSHAGSGPAPQNAFIVAQRVVIFGTGPARGLFVYSPVPGAGNLVDSIAAAAGTDSYGGNAYKAGITSYGAAGSFTELNAGTILIGDGGSVANATLGTASGQLNITGPAQAADLAAAIHVNSRKGSGDGVSPEFLSDQRIRVTGPVQFADIATPATPALGFSDLFSASGTPQLLRPSGWTAALPSTLTDTTDQTVTGTGATQLGGAFTIPAADAAVNTVYRYICGGTGTWGSTQQQLTLIESLAATNINQVNVAATAFAASAPVDWNLEMQIAVHTTGAGGSCNARLTLSMSVNNAAANTSNGVIAVRRAPSVAINTTIANTFQLNALWASTTGAPTISCNNSTFERIGP